MEWEQRRLIAANMFEQKLETKVIAASLAVDDQTVRRWGRCFRASGRDALLSSKHPGRPPRMTQQQRQQLAQLLIKSPADCGFAQHYLWTQQLIADLILREFGIGYHHDHMGVILHAIGFTHQKPMRRAKERDEARIETWRSETWPEILKKNAAGNGGLGGVILLADEVGFMMNPSVKKTWAPEACTPVAPYRNRRQKKVSVLGAVALHSASGHIDLLCDFHPVRLSSPKSDSYVRSEQAAAFVHRVLAEYSTGPIDLIWDNLNAHKSKFVKELLVDHPRLTLHYLPPYAPDLNAVEGIWCLTKHHRMANHSIDDLDMLHAEARRHPHDVGCDQHLLQSCFKHAGLALLKPRAQ